MPALLTHPGVRRLCRAGEPLGLQVAQAGEESWRIQCPRLGLGAAGPTMADACQALLRSLQGEAGLLLDRLPARVREEFVTALRLVAAAPV
jgi:hypothetical protein